MVMLNSTVLNSTAMKKLFILMPILTILSSCLYKSVMEGEADDIAKARYFGC